MNRLRFRVWDKEVQEFAHWPVYFNLTNSEVVTELWYGYEIQVEEPLQDSNYIVQQSTGLFDKNGKEIFEGDIIDKGYSNIDIVDRIGYVKFGTGDDSDGYLNQEWLGWTTNNDDSLLDVHEHCTVLGNKFEHPHLLGED